MVRRRRTGSTHLDGELGALAWTMALVVIAVIGVIVWVHRPEGDPPMEKAPKGDRIDSARVLTTSFPKYRNGFYVARTEREYRVISSYLERAQDASVDFSRTVIVIIATSTGCAEPQDAQLYARGDDLKLRRNVGEDSEECYAPYPLLTQFLVPRERMPAQPRYGGEPPTDIGVGVLVTEDSDVTAEPSNPSIRTLAITSGQDLIPWKNQFDIDSTAATLDAPPEGERRFAFLVPGCDPALPRVDIAPDGTPIVSLKSLKPYHSTPCGPQAHYFLVYDVPATSIST